MRLTVLGNSGTFPGPGRPCSSYLVEHDGFRLMVDAGNGALGTLQELFGLLAPDAVVLSHLHGDHCLDLVAYSYARRYHPDGPPPALPVWGPADTQERLCHAFEVRPEDELCEVYDFHQLRAGTMAIGPFTLTAAVVAHPVEAFGLRLSAGGRTLAYSGDTGPCTSVEDLARGADVFLCEASWSHGPDNPPGVHLSGRQAGEAATRAGAAQLLLTHIVPWLDPADQLEEARQTYDGRVGLALQGHAYDV